jgi:hypothetical protein
MNSGRPWTVIAVCAAAGGLAACGGSSSLLSQQQPHPGRAAVAGSAREPVRPAGHTSAPGRHGSGGRRGPTGASVPRISSSASPQRGTPTPALSSDDGRPVGSQAINPCTLITRPEARALSGGAIVGSFEAPLGPTCVFRLAHSKAELTLNIQTSTFAGLTRQLRARRRLTIRGHQAYCGRLGAQLLIVRLPADRLLQVTAPCVMAQKLAAVALRRLAA